MFAEVNAFIDEKAADFPTLKLDYPQGAYPVLSLYSEIDSETAEETISIDKWKIDHLVIAIRTCSSCFGQSHMLFAAIA
jgi:hypothetical protein